MTPKRLAEIEQIFSDPTFAYYYLQRAGLELLTALREAQQIAEEVRASADEFEGQRDVLRGRVTVLEEAAQEHRELRDTLQRRVGGLEKALASLLLHAGAKGQAAYQVVKQAEAALRGGGAG